MKLVEQIEFTVVYRSDGTSTTTIKNAVIFEDRRVGTVMTALAYPGTWALIDETPHSLQIESLANGAVVAITFLGDDTLLYDKVSEMGSGFVDHYRLERQSGGGW